jgi:hypothetical protein
MPSTMNVPSNICGTIIESLLSFDDKSLDYDASTEVHFRSSL